MAQKKKVSGVGRKVSAQKKSNPSKDYETAVFYQEARKKEAGAQKYLTDIKTNLRNAGYGNVKIALERNPNTGRAVSPAIRLTRTNPDLVKGFPKSTWMRVDKSNAKNYAKMAVDWKQNTATTGRSTNKKAK